MGVGWKAGAARGQVCVREGTIMGKGTWRRETTGRQETEGRAVEVPHATEGSSQTSTGGPHASHAELRSWQPGLERQEGVRAGPG